MMMAQASQSVSASQSGSAYADDVNAALLAVQTNHSGTTSPSYIEGLQEWADTTSNFKKLRNAANTSYFNLYPLNKDLSTYISEIVGAFGVGGNTPLKASDDLNTLDQTGFYRITGSTLNNSYGTASVIVIRRSSSIIDQIIISETDSKVYIRTTLNSGSLWTLKQTLATQQNTDTLFKNLQQPLPIVEYATATTMTVTVPEDITRINSAGESVTILASGSPYTIDMAEAGLDGLASGSFTVGTQYRIYMAQEQGDTTCGFTASATTGSTTLSLGGTTHDTFQMPFIFRAYNASGSAVIPRFDILDMTDKRCEVQYAHPFRIPPNHTSNPSLFASNVSPSTFTEYNFTNFMPALASKARFHIGCAQSPGAVQVRLRSVADSNQEFEYFSSLGGGEISPYIKIDASCDVEVISVNGAYLSVFGYIVEL